MFNQDYDEYLRSILGYAPNNRLDELYQGDFQQYQRQYDYTYQDINDENNRRELENCYPEIYSIVYPIIQKTCKKNTRGITKDLIEDMTNDVYNQVIQKDEVRLQSQTNNKNSDISKETRHFNKNLSDLIKILLIRELLRRPIMPGPRPHRPPMPPRPPMRPYNRETDIYEY